MNLSICWMSWQQYSEQIIDLRQTLYIYEQGQSAGAVACEENDLALHLGAFYQGRLVSMISGFFTQKTSKCGASAKCRVCDESACVTEGPVLRYGMRMVRPEYRGTGISEYLCIHMVMACYEVLRPKCTFSHLGRSHRALASHYRGWGFHPCQSFEQSGNLICCGPDQLLEQYLINRQKMEALPDNVRTLRLPPLTEHLQQIGRSDWILYDKLLDKNIHESTTVPAFELSRMTAQANVLFDSQSVLLNTLNQLPDSGRLLDVGAGPGVYLSRLSRHKKFSQYQCEGLDLSHFLHQYAMTHYPDIKRHLGSIYRTELEDQSYDFIHAGFLFIHLLSPDLALNEIKRLLKPGGLLYVLDVNDLTFDGPQCMKSLVERHRKTYEGNRAVMSILPQLAQSCGFELHSRFITRVNNKSASEQINRNKAELVLDDPIFLSMFQFIAHCKELSEEFEQATQFCLSHQAMMEIEIHTQIYAI